MPTNPRTPQKTAAARYQKHFLPTVLRVSWIVFSVSSCPCYGSILIESGTGSTLSGESVSRSWFYFDDQYLKNLHLRILTKIYQKFEYICSKTSLKDLRSIVRSLHSSHKKAYISWKHKVFFLILESGIKSAESINLGSQCFGSGPAWIRLGFGQLDPDPDPGG